MPQDTNTFFTQLERHRKRLAARQMLENVRGQLEAERRRLTDLDAELLKEQTDVQSLEGLSLAALFYTLLGSKEKQLDKERQQALSVKLRRDGCEHAVHALEKEVRQRDEHLRAIPGSEEEFAQALADREQALRSGDGPQAQRLHTLDQELAAARQETEDLQDAILAGEQALEALADLTDALESAENWGVWDVLGGGLLVTHAKHSRINDAKQIAHHAQQYLRRLQTEVQQFAGTPGVPDISGLLTFADYFFDGLIMDWVVQSRIRNGLGQVEETTSAVQEILTVLRNRFRTCNEQQRNLDRERREVLEQPEV